MLVDFERVRHGVPSGFNKGPHEARILEAQFPLDPGGYVDPERIKQLDGPANVSRIQTPG